MKERLHVLAAGGLLSRDMLNQISASDQALIGANPTDYGLVQGERIGDAAARSWNRLVGIWANFRQAESRLPQNRSHRHHPHPRPMAETIAGRTGIRWYSTSPNPHY